MTGKNLVPTAAEGRVGAIGYLAAVLLLPLLVLWHQDNALFIGFGYIDPWIYFGYFRDLLEFKRNLFVGNPYGAHLSWILPGAAIHSLFAPVTADYLLHLGVHTLATISLFLTLKWVAGIRRAFVGAMLFSVNPWLWAVTGSDYVAGIGIAYCLLTMALLTWAALKPSRGWALLPAGMVLAALLNAGAGWLTLAPLLPLYYAGLTWTWHRTSILRSLLALCGWFGAGCLIMTRAFSAINYFLDGHAASIPEAFESTMLQSPRFWLEFAAAASALVFLFLLKPKVDRAISKHVTVPLLIAGAIAGIAFSLISRGNNSPAPWRQGLWQDDAPSPWLLFPLIAVATALVALYSERRKWRSGISAPALLSLQLVCALAWMTYCQLRGRPELGELYSASKLLPFSFLVIGARFWPDVEKVRFVDYLIFCCVAAVTLGYAWLGEGMILVAGLPYAAWMGVGALLVSLFWIRFPEYLICSLGGFFVLTAVGVGARYGGIDAHAFREQMQSLSTARERIEIVRQGGAVRFWYDDKDAAMPDAVALISTYLGDGSILGRSFAANPCNRGLSPSTVVAAIAANPLHGPDFVSSALSACWSGNGIRVTPIEVDTFHRGSSSYTMSLLRIEAYR